MIRLILMPVSISRVSLEAQLRPGQFGAYWQLTDPTGWNAYATSAALLPRLSMAARSRGGWRGCRFSSDVRKKVERTDADLKTGQT